MYLVQKRLSLDKKRIFMSSLGIRLELLLNLLKTVLANNCTGLVVYNIHIRYQPGTCITASHIFCKH